MSHSVTGVAEGQVGGWRGYRRWEIWSSDRMVKTLLPLGVSDGSGRASRDATMFSISLTDSFWPRQMAADLAIISAILSWIDSCIFPSLP